jgi:phosphoribosylglycinamide formyltransferase-1
MKSIVLFASGSGSNAERIVKEHHQKNFNVLGVYCNNSKAGVIQKMQNLNVPVVVFSKKELMEPEFTQNLKNQNIDLIVLAGFLLHIPSQLIQAFPDKIVNIHPSLLPKYGGHGMYGMNVHQAVIENNERISGITIHYVNDRYDEGQIIQQFQLEVEKSDTAETLAEKIHILEHTHFGNTILKILNHEL